MRTRGKKMASASSSLRITPTSSPIKPRKRPRNEMKWQKNLRKAKKARGEEHTSYKGDVIPSRVTGPPCDCKRQCFAKFSEEDRLEIIRSFNDLSDKTLQDSYLHGLVTHRPVARRRPRKTAANNRRNSFFYKVCNSNIQN